jgi:hypothetical protein
MNALELIPFGRGRQSLEQSVWYSGHLLTFLATGVNTRGKFALIEIASRKGNVPPPHIHHFTEFFEGARSFLGLLDSPRALTVRA